MSFIVRFQHIYTTSNTPYNLTNSLDLVHQFRTEWNSNRGNVRSNIAHLFSGKSLTNGIGRAWQGYVENAFLPAASNSLAYGLSQYRVQGSLPETYQIVAHEIGHNLNASDANLVNAQVSDQCDCEKYNPLPPYNPIASVMCQGGKNHTLWFCPFSINEINGFISRPVNTHLKSLGSISIFLSTPNATGFNTFYATETINSTQTIQSGYTLYKAGKSVILNSGFRVESGAEFSIEIKDYTDCDD